MAISTIGTDALASAAVTSAKLASGAPSRSQLPAGTVLQVVNATYATQAVTSSSSFSDTGLTATITPSSATSKVLVLVDQNGVYADGSANAGLEIWLQRNSSNLSQLAGRAAGDKANSVVMSIGSVSSAYLDSPATTSATTYRTRFNSVSNASAAYVQVYSAASSITLMEIAQ